MALDDKNHGNLVSFFQSAIEGQQVSEIMLDNGAHAKEWVALANQHADRLGIELVIKVEYKTVTVGTQSADDYAVLVSAVTPDMVNYLALESEKLQSHINNIDEITKLSKSMNSNPEREIGYEFER